MQNNDWRITRLYFDPDDYYIVEEEIQGHIRNFTPTPKEHSSSCRDHQFILKCRDGSEYHTNLALYRQFSPVIDQVASDWGPDDARVIQVSVTAETAMEFTQVLKNYPNMRYSTPEVYWMAECLFVTKLYRLSDNPMHNQGKVVYNEPKQVACETSCMDEVD